MPPLTYRLDARELEVWMREILAARRATPAYRTRWWETVYTVFAIAALVAVALSAAERDPHQVFPALFLAAVLPLAALFVVAALGARWRFRRWCAAAADRPAYGGPHRLHVDSEGVHQASPALTQSIPRAGVAKVTEKGGLVLIWFSTDLALAIPGRAFGSPADKAAFIAEISPTPGI